MFYESISYDGNEIGGLGKISKDTIDSKVKTPIFACEIEIGSLFLPVKVHTDVSEFPASYRDLSFSLESHDGLKKLSDLINLVSKENNLLDDYFIFDFFENKKLSILKVGYRFKFQSVERSLTDEEIDKIMKIIIKKSTKSNDVTIQGI